MNTDLYPKEARQYLRMEFGLRQQRNPGYSLRAFARDLEMGPSTLCEFLAGRLGLSRGRAEQISQRLQLNSEHHKHFLDLLEASFGRNTDLRKAAKWRIQRRLKENRSHLPAGAFEVVADWYHFPILELLELDPKFQDPSELARVLDVKVQTVKAAIQRMERLELLKSEDGVLKPSDTMTFTGDEVPSQAIRQSHMQVLDLAQKALMEKSMEDRDSLSLFLSIPQSRWTEFCKEMRGELLRVAQNYAAANDKDALVAVAYQTFPIYFPEKQNAP